MIDSQIIEKYKISDFEEIMNTKIKMTLKNPVNNKLTGKDTKIFKGQIISLGLSSNSPHLPVSIDFQIENSDAKITTNIFQIENIEL